MGEPLVSLVFCGRNDSHGGDFAYRASSVLNMLGRHAHRLGLGGTMELVFVDWLSEGQKLRDVLDLTPETEAITTFLSVERRHLPVDSEMRFDFLPHFALNAGVRRANGRFIGICDCDTLYPVAAIHGLMSVLSGEAPANFDLERSFFPLRRYRISPTVVARKPTVEKWETLLDTYVAGSVQEQASSFHLGGFAGAQLLPASAWYELQGYDEHFKRPWGWVDNHLHMRALLAYGPIDLASYGVFGFHMERGDQLLRYQPPVRKSPDSSRVNVQEVSYRIDSGVMDWGLGAQDLPRQAYSGRAAGSIDDFALFAPPRLESYADLFALLKDQARLAEFDEINFSFFHSNPFECWQADLLVGAYGLARTRLPNSVVFVGDLVPEMFIPIIYSCTHTDVLALGAFPEGPAQESDFNLERLSIVLATLKFCGRWRTVNSWDKQIVSRAMSSMVSRIELIVVHFEMLSPELFGAVRERLAPGGVILIFWRSPELKVAARHLKSIFDTDVVHQQGPTHPGLLERFTSAIPETLRSSMRVLPSPSGAALLCVNQ